VCHLSVSRHVIRDRDSTFGPEMKTSIVVLLWFALWGVVIAQEESAAVRLHISFEYGAQIPLADMEDRFGSNFNLGSQFELLHTRSLWLAGIKGYYVFGSTVREDVISNLRTPEGEVIGNDGGPAILLLRERGFFIGPYAGKVINLNKKVPHAGLKFQLGMGLLQHQVRIQDDSRTVEQLSGDYRKGYDRLSNGLGAYVFAGYQHLDPKKRVNFLAGFDMTWARTQSRRDYDFNLMRTDTEERTDILVGFRIGWIVPITTGVAPGSIYY